MWSLLSSKLNNTCGVRGIWRKNMERYIGLIYSFASGANFGFILRNDIEKFREIFFHINNFEEYGIPQIGDIVEFSEGSNAKGVVANNIKLLDEYSKENVYHKIIHIILDRELLTNKYVKFHQAAFKYIEEICSNVPELKEEAI